MKTVLILRFFILGEPEREYSFVDAPATFEVNKEYSDKPTPTIVVRNMVMHGMNLLR